MFEVFDFSNPNVRTESRRIKVDCHHSMSYDDDCFWSKLDSLDTLQIMDTVDSICLNIFNFKIATNKKSKIKKKVFQKKNVRVSNLSGRIQTR